MASSNPPAGSAAPGLAKALDSLSDDGDAPTLVTALLQDAVGAGASDIHVDPAGHGYRIRYRIHGALRMAAELHRPAGEILSRAIEVSAKIDRLTGRSRPEGRLELPAARGGALVRVSSIAGTHGSKLSLRLPDPSLPGSLAELGMGSAEAEGIESFVEACEGLLLIGGASGAGKTTTAYALIEHLGTGERNLITLEDPAERLIDTATQVEIGRGADTYSEGVRAALRHDPDALLIGEIRDQATAAAAIDAALGGHLVIATIHALDAAGVVDSMRSLGVDPYELGAALHMVVCQKIVRRLCDSCAVQASLSPPGREVLRGAPDNAAWKEAAGCEACAGSGYSGSLGLFENWRVTEAERAAILGGAGGSELRELLRSRSLPTLRERAIGRAARGEISMQDAISVVSASA